MADDFRPIIGHGESYITRDPVRSGAPVVDKRPPFETVREHLLSDINTLKDDIHRIPNDYKVDKVVVSMKMALGYTAKSYHPNLLINQSGAVDVGSKKWTQTTEDSKGNLKVRNGKIVFMQVSEQELNQLEQLLHLPESRLLKDFVKNVRTIDSLYLDKNDGLLKPFLGWDTGRVEFVLHPFHDSEKIVIKKFTELYQRTGGDSKKIKVRSYYPGPTFISAPMTKDSLREIIKFNPIRTAHPLTVRSFPSIRGGLTQFKLPNTPSTGDKSSVTVGMFDGGINNAHPWLQRYATERNPIPTQKDSQFLAHGTAVAGAILYGDLSTFTQDTELSTPTVNIESFRVFPLSDPNDFDLYEVIDIIEDTVPKKPDITVYNLSIGPYGPIEDDYISRFTFVVDGLSENGERLFTVAVGNDGDIRDEAGRRIQAPSDAVNALGIGAFTYNSSNIPIKAPYSSIGEGREGCKIKPDVMAFGGSEQKPFHLLGLDEKNRLFAAGTSFAAPLVAAKAAEIIGRCNIANPLVARTLLIHNARHPQGKHDRYLGYGIIPDDIQEILGCSPNKVTVLYKSRILPKNYARLPIPIVPGLDYDGEVDVIWTISLAVKTNPLATEDYTSHCIEDYFYPNQYEYKFTSPDKKHKYKRHVIKSKKEVEQWIEDKWKQSSHPVTLSGNVYKNEDERRAEFKWDTVVKKAISAKYLNLESPYLVLHAMDRNTKEEATFIEYAVAVTVHYKNYDKDAYQLTLENFSQLEVAQVRSRNELLLRQ